MKQTEKTLLMVTAAVAAYFIWKQMSAANAGNAETPSELLASTNATVAGDLASMFSS